MPTAADPEGLAAGLLAEYESLAALSDGLDDAAWTTPTRCPGWEVRDALGHVAGLAADAASGNPGARTAEQQATDMRNHTPAEIAAQLRTTGATMKAFFDGIEAAAWDAPVAVPDMTLAIGVRALWFDAYVHGDDVRTALGMPAERGAALAASVVYLAHLLTERGWGPVTLVLDGLPPCDVGRGGRHITGDPHRFMLVASGRAEAAPFGLDARVNVYG